MYEVLLAGHLLCAVLWAGGGVTLHLLGRRSLAEGPEAAVAQAERGGWFGAHVYAPLSVLLLLFGILLVGEAGYKHSQLWVAIAYAGWLIAFALGAFVYRGWRSGLRTRSSSTAARATRPSCRSGASWRSTRSRSPCCCSSWSTWPSSRAPERGGRRVTTFAGARSRHPR